ncbi:MAG TPA: aldose 1-epimerase [Alphaproteobacteria bacterium]
MAGPPPLVRLAAGPFVAELCPEVGGSLARFVGWGHDLLRPVSDADLAAREPRRLGCYPLIPFSNRVREAQFIFDGERYRLARNFLPEPHAIHGNAWQRAWQVDRQAADAARLVLVHDPARDGAAPWPFAYRAALDFQLAAEGLTVRLSVENTDRRRMPAGFGLHPFFPLTTGTRLAARLEGVWLNDERKLPESHVALPPAWDFTSPAPVPPLSVDNCFTGWAGAARLEWPDRGLRLDIDASAALGNLVIFVPQAHDYFCVEPVSNVNDGFTLAAAGVANTGVVALAPGETLAGEIRFKPALLSRA